jgi:hypothetical protein
MKTEIGSLYQEIAVMEVKGQGFLTELANAQDIHK